MKRSNCISPKYQSTCAIVPYLIDSLDGSNCYLGAFANSNHPATIKAWIGESCLTSFAFSH